MITIVDYGIGNLGAMLNMLKRIGVSANIESSPEKLHAKDKIILPGVGAFDAAMQRINEIVGLREVLDHKALNEKIPILGVCVGMQLLTNSSEEGVLSGLGWIPASVKLFPKEKDLKVPHMGWNTAVPTHTLSPLTAHMEVERRYYFVHSYYVQVEDPCYSLMKTHYGLEFDSAIGHENIYGVQFHPEKSHRFGMQILKNFAKL